MNMAFDFEKRELAIVTAMQKSRRDHWERN